MSRVTRHKYGGPTTSNHSYCPSRVSIGDRRTSECPNNGITAEYRKERKARVLKPSLYLITAFISGIVSYSGYSKCQERKIEVERNDTIFLQIRSQMGGSVLEPLIEKCNRLDDRTIPSGGKNVKSAIMKQLAGKIGPVNYRQTIRTKTITSTASVGRFSGTTIHGTPVSGDILGEVTTTKTKVGAYNATTPAGFKEAFAKLQSLTRHKHARACAEVGACIFVEVTKGQIGMDDRCALSFFKKAAEYGDVDGMFMYAFCLYHGIGSSFGKPKTDKAYEEILKLQSALDNYNNASVTRDIFSSGWINRRLMEVRGIAK